MPAIFAWGRGPIPAIFDGAKPVTDDERRDILERAPSAIEIYCADWTIRVAVPAAANLDEMIVRGEMDGYAEVGLARVIPFLSRPAMRELEKACRKYGFTADELPASLRPFIKLED